MSTTTDAQAAPPASATGLGGLLATRPLTSYFVLAFLGTWLFQLPMVLSSDGLGLIPYRVPFGIFVALFLLSSFAGPTVAAVVVTHALEGRAGVVRFFRRYGLWRVGVMPYLFIFFGFPILWLLALSTQLGITPWQAVATNAATFVTSYLPGVLIFPAIIQWGEEPGWRGFALTRLQERYGPLVAALVVGFFHGLWHLPNFLMVNGPTAAGPFNAVSLLFNTAIIMVVSVIWSWVFNNAKQSILIAVLVHAAFNATGAWMNGLIPQMPPSTADVLYGVYGVVALLIVVATRGRLGYKADHAPAIPVRSVQG